MRVLSIYSSLYFYYQLKCFCLVQPFKKQVHKFCEVEFPAGTSHNIGIIKDKESI